MEKGAGVVDVFYFYFWAFNWGGVVLGKQLGKNGTRENSVMMTHGLSLN